MKELLESLQAFFQKEDIVALGLGFLIGGGQQYLDPSFLNLGAEKEMVAAAFAGVASYRIWDMLTGRLRLIRRAQRMQKLLKNREKTAAAEKVGKYLENYRLRAITASQFLSSLDVLAAEFDLFLQSKS